MDAGAAHPRDEELASLALRHTEASAPPGLIDHVSSCSDCRRKVDSLRSVDMESTFHSGENPLPEDLAGTGEALEAGKQLGRYTILERIGSGGMGEVYAAYDPQLDRRVALKLLRPDRTRRSDEARARLLREAQAMARLAHPNVVTVHDVGVFGDEVFVAMEFVDGATLAEWLAERPRTLDEVLAVFHKAGEGLAAAHDAGLVHRDFKPSNVLIGKDGRVRVLDFGLARTSRADGRAVDLSSLPVELAADGDWSIDRSSQTPLHTPLTHHGAIVGTPGYMAPEQLRGEVIDPRVDQFSFCAALYEGLYGERPFRGETMRELAQATIAGISPQPRDEARVPARVYRTIARGLSPAIDQRFADMRALLAELTPTTRRRAWLPAWGWAVAAVALIAAVSAGAVLRGEQAPSCAAEGAAISEVWSDARRADLAQRFLATKKAFAADAAASTARALDQYAQDWTTLRTETCEARARGEISESVAALRTACFELRLEETRSLLDVLLHPDAAIAQNAVAAVSRLDRPQSCLHPEASLSVERLPSDPAARARVEALRSKVVAANALFESGKYQEALDAAQPLVVEAAVSGSHALEAAAYFTVGAAEERLTQYAEAREHLNLSARAALMAGDDLSAARAWTLLVLVTGRDLSDFPDAAQWSDYAEAALSRSGHNPRAEAELAHQRGVMLTERGDYDLALSEAKRALAIHEKALGVEDPQLVRILDNLGWTLSWQGDQDAAAATYVRAMAIAERLFGPEHPDVAHVLDRYASVLAEKDQLKLALEYSKRALQIRESSLAPQNPEIGVSLNHLALLYLQDGRPHQGRVLAARGSALIRAVFGEDHALLGHVVDTEGQLALADGDAKAALAHFTRASQIYARSLGANTTPRFAALRGVGSSQLRLGHPEKAVQPLEEALAAYERVGIYASELALARMDLGRALWLTNQDRQRARELMREAREEFTRAGARNARELAELDRFVKEHVK